MESDNLTRKQFEQTSRYLMKLAAELERFEDRMERKGFPRSDFLLDGVKPLRESMLKLAAECDYRAITAK